MGFCWGFCILGYCGGLVEGFHLVCKSEAGSRDLSSVRRKLAVGSDILVLQTSHDYPPLVPALRVAGLVGVLFFVFQWSLLITLPHRLFILLSRPQLLR